MLVLSRHGATRTVNIRVCENAHGVAVLRELTPADLPAIVKYWLSSSDEFLAGMGADRRRLGSKEEIHQRFSKAIRKGDPDQNNIGLAITLDERLAGYTLLNRYSDEVNYSHWHIIEAELRARGLSTALYPHRIKTYFELAPIARLIHQTRTTNVGVNRMLDRFVPVAETKYIEKPDGVAAPGEFYIRFVTRSDIPKIFARAGDPLQRPR